MFIIMWDLIVSVPDHCLSFNFLLKLIQALKCQLWLKRNFYGNDNTLNFTAFQTVFLYLEPMWG